MDEEETLFDPGPPKPSRHLRLVEAGCEEALPGVYRAKLRGEPDNLIESRGNGEGDAA